MSMRSSSQQPLVIAYTSMLNAIGSSLELNPFRMICRLRPTARPYRCLMALRKFEKTLQYIPQHL